ncbi:MAG: TIGR02679 family protein [Thermincolia bacterium]
MTNPEMLKYFSQPGFRRLFQGIRKKYQSLGRIGGKVQLRNLTPGEHEVLGGFFGRNLAGQAGLTVDLAEVDRVIRESRFGLGLAELLPLYFREELQSNQELAREQRELWEGFFSEIEPLAVRPKTREWVQVLKEGKESGYRTLLSLYQEDWEEAARVAKACVAALDELPALKGDRCRRTVFAARLTGNPHGLDRTTWLGRLLYSGMLYVLGVEEVPSLYRAEHVRAVFRRAGLEEDDLSSNVITVGLRTRADDPRAGLFEGAWESGSPLILPLRFFEQKTAWFPFEAVYVVENPTVLSAVLDEWGGPGCPPLVCPSGQPSVAALRLLDELAAGGTKIYYSGDFDGKGLEIGLGLWKRYQEAFVPWLFDTGVYEGASAGTPLSGEQRKRLGSMEVPWDMGLSKVVLRRGYVVYQEVLVEKMMGDLRRNSGE